MAKCQLSEEGGESQHVSSFMLRTISGFKEMSVRSAMKHLNKQGGDAGFPQQHAQSRQWWRTRQDLVSVPGMRTQIHTNTHDRGVQGEDGFKGKGRGRGRTLQTTCRQILPLIGRHS